MIISLLGQGVCSGLVVCIGQEGHIAIEMAHNQHCNREELIQVQTVQGQRDDPDIQMPIPSPRSLPVVTIGPAANNADGPCSDIPLSPNPFKLPVPVRKASVSPILIMALALDTPAVRANTSSTILFNLADLSLIPIKTTSLLI